MMSGRADPPAPSPSRQAADRLAQETDWKAISDLVGGWRKEPALFRRELVAALRERLGSRDPVALRNYADMFVLSRVEAGRMAFHLHGLKVDQDVFTVGGLRAWVIEQVTEVELPPLSAEDSDAKWAEKQKAVERIVDQALGRLK